MNALWLSAGLGFLLWYFASILALSANALQAARRHYPYSSLYNDSRSIADPEEFFLCKEKVLSLCSKAPGFWMGVEPLNVLRKMNAESLSSAA